MPDKYQPSYFNTNDQNGATIQVIDGTQGALAEQMNHVANETARVAELLKLKLQFQITTMENTADDLIKEYIKAIEVKLNEI